MNKFVFLSWWLANTWNLKSKFKFQVFPSCQDRKTNSSVRFLGEVTARQFCFEIYWPLGTKSRITRGFAVYEEQIVTAALLSDKFIQEYFLPRQFNTFPWMPFTNWTWNISQWRVLQISILFPLYHGLRTPNEPFFHWNPEFLGLGRQIGQINAGVFGVFSAKLSAPILVQQVPCPFFFNYSTIICTKT